MLCYILVISLALPPFILGQDSATENNNQTTCDTPDVKDAYDKVYNCFSQNVNSSIKISVSACALTPLTFEYIKVANKSCYNNSRSVTAAEKDATKFVKLVEYSLRHQEYKDFVKNGGVICLNSVKNKILDCVNREVGTAVESELNDKTRKYENLWKMTRISTDSTSCKTTNSMKHCILTAMRDGGCNNCTHENNVLYVGSLFNYVLERCSRETPNWMDVENEKNKEPLRNEVDRKTRTTHALLGVLLAMGILAMFYVCLRDCRAPRGQWKAINERISMSMMNRRRSLVNNEACQQN